MGIDIYQFLAYFSGGLMISSAYLVTHLICTLNPHHRPVAPLLACVSTFTMCVLFSGHISNDSVKLSTRESVSDAMVGIVGFLPLFLPLLCYALALASIRSRPRDY
ncbi:MAG TPA: hypothetical protein QF641_02505 [Candidatus Thalassarchaeaceae archaeon]|nr:hypothetical protein [Candidatus Thalassarchaeaceae archaeon]